MRLKIILLFCLPLGFLSGQTTLSSSLVACYPLNINASEPINNLTGTLSAVTTTLDRNNNLMSAFHFGGTWNSYIELPDDTLLKPNAISFSAWVKAFPGSYADPYILYTGTSFSATSGAYSLAFVNVFGGKKFRVWKRNGTTLQGVATVTVQTNNVWYHVCFTMDNSTIKLYLDGVFQASVTTTIPFSYGIGKSVFLGSNNEPSALQAFTGIIDNVRFYNRILSAAEITQLYTLDPACVTATVAPVASFSTSNTSFCVGEPVQFWDQSANYPTSWMWGAPGATTTNIFLANPIFTFSTVGTYTVKLTATNPFGFSTSSMVININPIPTLSASVSPTLICREAGGTVTAWGALTYTWAPGNNTGSPLNIYPIAQTIYTVSGGDSLGCVGTKTLVVKVSFCHHYPPPPTALQDHSSISEVSIFPNPGAGILAITSGIEMNTVFSLYDRLGTKVLSGKIEGVNTININISDKPAGIYFLRLNDGTRCKTVKIIKE